MNRNHLPWALWISLVPASAFSLGMGDMNIMSSLDQPFQAEVPLLQVNRVSLENIKVNVATPDDYVRIGLERNDILTSFHFEVKKDKQGRAVIVIRSNERVTEPFFEILVEVTWPEGQFLRQYDVLLDPPDYGAKRPAIRIVHGEEVTTVQAVAKAYPTSKSSVSVTESSSQTSVASQAPSKIAVHETVSTEQSYGPTVANEDIWQIAQRYTKPGVSADQVILGIVGANSKAFTQGNLNGLKAGEQLQIPSFDEIKTISVDLAQKEVDAHNTAWHHKQAIQHVLLPPYIDDTKNPAPFPADHHAAVSKNSNALTDSNASSVIPVQTVPASTSNNVSTPPVSKDSRPAVQTPNSSQNLITSMTAFFSKETPNQIEKPAGVGNPIVQKATGNQEAHLEAELRALKTENKQLSEKLNQLNQSLHTLNQRMNQAKSPSSDQAERVTTSEILDSSAWKGLWWLAMGGAAAFACWYIYRRYQETMPHNQNELYSDETSLDDVEEVYSINNLDAVAKRPSQSEHIIQSPEQAAFTSANLGNEAALSPSLYSKLAKVSETAEPIKEADEDEDNIVTFVKPPEMPASSKTFDNQLYATSPKEALASDEIEEPQAPEESNPHIVEFDSTGFQQAASSIEKAPVLDAAAFHQEIKKPSVMDAVVSDESAPAAEMPKPPLVKSASALNTLIDLARTYISMEDFEAAKQALNEVKEYGDANQKTEVTLLLEELNKKNTKAINEHE